LGRKGQHPSDRKREKRKKLSARAQSWPGKEGKIRAVSRSKANFSPWGCRSKEKWRKDHIAIKKDRPKKRRYEERRPSIRHRPVAQKGQRFSSELSQWRAPLKDRDIGHADGPKSKQGRVREEEKATYQSGVVIASAAPEGPRIKIKIENNHRRTTNRTFASAVNSGSKKPIEKKKGHLRESWLPWGIKP